MKHINYSIITLLLIACQNSNQTVSVKYLNDYSFELHNQYSIVDKINCQFYLLKNTIPTITIYSSIDTCIDYYRIPFGTKIKTEKIKLYNEFSIRAYKQLNDTTLFFTDQLSPNYIIYNYNKGIIDSFSILPKNYPQIQNISYGNFNDGASINSIIYENNFIFILQRYFAPYYFLDEYSDLFRIKINSNCHKSTDISKLNIAEYSNNFKIWTGNSTPHITSTKKKIILSYYNNKDLYILDINELKITKKNCNSCSYFNPQPPFDTTKMNDPFYYIKYSLKSNGYGQIKYDPFRNLIYRIFELPSVDTAIYDPYINPLEGKPFVLMIYNENFDLIGEVKFPEGRYFYNTIIPIPEGLLISTINEKNTKYDESKLQFDLFEIKQ